MRHRERDPDWVTPEVKALQRAAWRRQAMIGKTLLPCPKCGNTPVVDLGFADAPHQPGQEFIHCPTYIIGVPGIPDQACGVHSIGAAAWNWRGPDGPVAGGSHAGR
jgi:hypothetical protein